MDKLDTLVTERLNTDLLQSDPVDYVFDRGTGDPHQEIGGTMVTLAAQIAAAQ